MSKKDRAKKRKKKQQEKQKRLHEEASVQIRGLEILDLDKIDVEELAAEEVKAEENSAEEINVEEINVEEIDVEELAAEEVKTEEINVEDIKIAEIDIEDLEAEETESGEPTREDDFADIEVLPAITVQPVKKKSKKKILLPICACLVVVVLGGLAYLSLPYLEVKSELTVEAGSDLPELDDFLNWSNADAAIVSGLTEDIDMNTVADYDIVIETYHRTVNASLHVEDTIQPVVEVQDQTIFLGQKVEAEDFIKEIDDVTNTTVAFGKEPDYDSEGTEEVTILVTDEGENVTESTAHLEVVADTTPPVIEGVQELTTTVGGSISYKKGIKVTDDLDEDVELSIDNSEVDLNTAGDYTVTYTAVDHAGNQTTVTTTVHVETPSVETATEDTINAAADEILASILTDGMSQYEQAEAIYWWCHDKIAYVDGTPKVNYVQGAYRGLVDRRGDCYTYAMTAKCLLTRAGIKNMDIERIPSGNSMHYWNLIDIGEGWYHYDTCRRADGTTFFYKTDAEIKAYSDAHNGTHNYDRSKYPTIN
jgi:hypothetical protein